MLILVIYYLSAKFHPNPFSRFLGERISNIHLSIPIIVRDHNSNNINNRDA